MAITGRIGSRPGPLVKATLDEWSTGGDRAMAARPLGPVDQACPRPDSQRDVNWILPFDLFGFLEQAGSATAEEVHLFGFSYVWHGLRDMIAHLNQHSIVHIYTLAPFIEFPEDLSLARCDASGESLGSRSEEHRHRSAPGRGDSDLAGRLSIVEQWGRPGREYFRDARRDPGG